MEFAENCRLDKFSEDLIVSFDDGDFDKYLRVFRMIFEKLHHIDHYNMMMAKKDSKINNI